MQRPSPPPYANLGARVTLDLELDPQGDVINVFPEQTSRTAAGKAHVAQKGRRAFERPSIATAQKCKFNVTERMIGRANESTVRIPIAYLINDVSIPQRDKRWQGFVPSPIHAIPWVSSDSIVVEEAPTRLKGDAAQLQISRFRLKQEVVGTNL